MRCTTHIIFTLVISAAVSCAAATDQYEVGFREELATDYSRSFDGKNGRPVQVAIWHPARKSKRQRLVTFERYLELSARKTEKTHLGDGAREKIRKNWTDDFTSYNVPESSVPDLIGAVTNVVEGAQWADGKFPLLVYAAGAGGESFENHLLAEYLASRGWIVAGISSVGPHSEEPHISPDGLDSAARDIEFAIHYAASTWSKHLLHENIALAGWSWGALAAMLVDSRNTNISMVISLDGAIAMQRHNIDAFPSFDPSRVRTPHVFLTVPVRRARHRGFIDEAKYSKSYLIALEGTTHVDFTSYRHMALSAQLKSSANVDTESSANFYPNMLELLFELLSDGEATGDGSASALNKFLDQHSDATVYENEPLPTPIDRKAYLDLLASDFEQAMRVAVDIKSRNPEYRILNWRDYIETAYVLYYDHDMKKETILLLEHAIREFPHAYALVGHLARFHERLGNLETAIDFFTKAQNMAAGEMPSFDREDNLRFYESRLGKIFDKLELPDK